MKDETGLLGIPTASTETVVATEIIIEKFTCLEKDKWI